MGRVNMDIGKRVEPQIHFIDCYKISLYNTIFKYASFNYILYHQITGQMLLQWRNWGHFKLVKLAQTEF